MISKKPVFLLIFALMLSPVVAQQFIRVEGTQFLYNGQPYRFIGTNFWYGMNLASKGEDGDRERLLKELDHLKTFGLTNLRIMAASEGPDSEPWRMVPALLKTPGQYDEAVLDGLDFLLAEMGRRGMHAVVCLNNFWPWSGGMAQYVNWFEAKKIPYPPPAKDGNWWEYMKYTTRFYKNKRAQKAYLDHIAFLINRKNPYTGKLYRDDPTIMAWQLANEPRGVLKAKAMNRWIAETAAFIKTLDQNHLVSVGSEGNTSSFTAGNNFVKNHSSPHIDYTTIHIWVQNWGWYDPLDAENTFPKALEKAKKYMDQHINLAQTLNKPVVLEEFGISRDKNDHDIQGGLMWRNEYFEAVFEMVFQKAGNGPLAGCNFWAWGGLGRPSAPKAIWQKGDDFIGDPPHEYQGWYSVYDVDEETLDIIKTYSLKIKQIK